MQPGAFAKGQISSINSVPSRPFSRAFSFAFFPPLSFKQPYLFWAASFRASEACIGQALETDVPATCRGGFHIISGWQQGDPMSGW